MAQGCISARFVLLCVSSGDYFFLAPETLLTPPLLDVGFLSAAGFDALPPLVDVGPLVVFDVPDLAPFFSDAAAINAGGFAAVESDVAGAECINVAAGDGVDVAAAEGVDIASVGNVDDASAGVDFVASAGVDASATDVGGFAAADSFSFSDAASLDSLAVFRRLL